MKLCFDAHFGFGDSIHQRAAIRQLLARGDEVWLPTAAPCLYHDLVGPQLHLMSGYTALRTQSKNARRESDRFDMTPVPHDVPRTRVSYGAASVRHYGSVPAAICAAFGVDSHQVDFRLPVPRAWRAKAPYVDGEYIVYRPPVARREWEGAAPRNPDPKAYRTIFDAVRDGYRTVSVADLAPAQEWIVGDDAECDSTFHAGELDIEALIGLVSRASLVVTTPGLFTVAAQALSVPCITVFGGYESARSYSSAFWAPWLPIEPVSTCDCWSHVHACDKTIDIDRAIERASMFASMLPEAA